MNNFTRVHNMDQSGYFNDPNTQNINYTQGYSQQYSQDYNPNISEGTKQNFPQNREFSRSPNFLVNDTQNMGGHQIEADDDDEEEESESDLESDENFIETATSDIQHNSLPVYHHNQHGNNPSMSQHHSNVEYITTTPNVQHQHRQFKTLGVLSTSNTSSKPYPHFLCDGCQKISDTCYFCFQKEPNFKRKVNQFELYNQPNKVDINDVVRNCDKNYIYEENVDNVDKIYDPYITRCKIDDDIVNGRKVKKDHPGFCRYCLLMDDWNENFYERNNSRYRGHMINTHGIHPNGSRVKLPANGIYCYKWIRNHWFETSGFYCPYDGCLETFTIGEKGHGFHEYLRHWSKKHA